jgi:hypothetical protein
MPSPGRKRIVAPNRRPDATWPRQRHRDPAYGRDGRHGIDVETFTGLYAFCFAIKLQRDRPASLEHPD